MKKVHSRLAKGLAACLLVSTLAATPVFAGSIGPDGIDPSHDDYVAIGKDLVIYNDGYNKSYSPAVVYTYTIAPATVAAGTTVVDSVGKTISVSGGLDTAIVGVDSETKKATTTVEFTSQEQVDTGTSLSMAIRKNIVFSFDLTKFQSPGIYRYEVKDETPAANLVKAGIVRPGDYEDTKYLDVYVIRATNPQTGEPTDGFEIAGYVLLDENTSVTETVKPKDPGYRSSVTDVQEIPVPGTVIPGDPTDPDDDVTVTPGITGVDGDNSFDYYYTYNLEVDKSITGNMADKTHAFPFAIEISSPAGTTVGSMVYVDDTAVSGASLSTTLADNEKYYVYGINPLASIDITETNNTASTYSASYKINNGAASAALQINNNETCAAEDITVSNYNSAATAIPSSITGDDQVVAFTNDLTAGPPTGVMLAIAPFAGVAALAGGAFVASKIHSKKKNEGSDLSEELKSE